MKSQLAILVLAATTLTGMGPAVSQQPTQNVSAAPAGAEASIPFVNHGGVYDFEADGREAVYIQDRARRWYHARLMGPCIDLPFAETLGFETRGPDTLDRFGTLIVRGQRCPIESLVKSGPPPRKERRKHG